MGGRGAGHGPSGGSPSPGTPCRGPDADYSAEPPTLVEFTPTETATGALLRIVESGFDKLPKGRRDEALQMNEGGWTEQSRNIAEHVERAT